MSIIDQARSLVRRANDSGLPAEIEYYGEDRQYPMVRVDFPAGNGTRSARLFDRDIQKVQEFKFENVRFSERYEAIVDTETGEIEASLDFTRALSGGGGVAESMGTAGCCCS